MLENPFGGVNPIFRVTDLSAALDYYVRVLGFQIVWQYPYFASVRNGRCELFLSVGDQGHPGAWIWVGTADVQTLSEHLEAKGAKIRHPPSNYPWALEMQVEDPDGNVIRIGSDSIPNRPFGEWLDMYGDRWSSPAGEWQPARLIE